MVLSKNKIKYFTSKNEYDDLILTSEQEEQLEEAGIDTFDFECMNTFIQLYLRLYQ